MKTGNGSAHHESPKAEMFAMTSLTEQLRRAVVALLPRRPSQQAYRDLADLLRAEADRLERLAGAEQRSIERGSPVLKGRTGRPRGSGATFVRFEPGGGRHSARLHIGRRLYQELGEPKRLDPQRLGGELHLRPCGASEGYAVTRPVDGMPRIGMGVSVGEALGLYEGRFEATIRDGAIVARITGEYYE